MANNYTLFSEMIESLTPAAAEWVETLLGLNVDTDEAAIKELCYELGLELTADTKEELSSFPNFCWKIEGADRSALWLYSEEGLTDQHLIWFVQALINKFLSPDYIFTANFACTCSKPRVGEFGGYWLAISKDDVKAGNTWDAAKEACKPLLPMSDAVHSQVRRIETEIDHILTDTNVEPKVLAEALRRLAASAEERDA